MSVIDTTEYCRYCLMCRHMCPVGHVTHLESHTPHGWAQIVAAQKRGLIDWSDETVAIMYNCADCGVCQSHCVTDQPLPDAIAAVRTHLVEEGLAPSPVAALKAQLEQWENAYKEQGPEPADASQNTYALFVGDAAVHLWPDTLPAALTLLSRIGIEPALIGRGRNSGYLPSSVGLPGIAASLAAKNLEELAETSATKLLVLCPADRYTFEHLYTERLSKPVPDGIEVVEVVSLLDRHHQDGSLGLRRIEMGLPYAYVDPTQAIRFDDRHEAPRRLLEAVLPTPPARPVLAERPRPPGWRWCPLADQPGPGQRPHAGPARRCSQCGGPGRNHGGPRHPSPSTEIVTHRFARTRVL